MRITLASASPRRKELMKLVTDEFDVRPSSADETLPKGIAAEKAAEYLSVKKAESVSIKPDEIVVGCDTTVVIDGIVLGKPKSEEDCFNMLRMLSGKTHSVYTGVTLKSAESSCSFTEKTEVEFFELSDEEIREYIKTGEPFDKAGGYGIQGKGAVLVKGICGDFFNVVGLPAARLKRELREFLALDMDKEACHI